MTAAGVCVCVCVIMYVRTGMGAAAAAALADDDKGQKPDAGSYQAPSISQTLTGK